MARSKWLGLISTGLFAGMLGTTFLGCYESRRSELGTCEEDNNPCTMDSCTTGATTHTPYPDGEICSLGDNPGKCQMDSSGLSSRCVLDCETNPDTCRCDSASECPADETCATWACNAGRCARSPANEGMLIDGAQTANDCKKTVCTAGEIQTVDDYEDKPLDTIGDCQAPACNAGVPGSIDDNMDEPPDNECVAGTCLNGQPVMSNAAPGTHCMNGTRACNSNGECVSCLSVSEMATCTSCPVKLCGGEACTLAISCQSNFCADGVCCNETCTGECKGCNVAGSVGTCSNILYYENDPVYTHPVTMNPAASCNINSGAVCNGMGSCRKIVGKTCAMDNECVSGQCSTSTPRFCKGAKGESCNDNSLCASGVCDTNGACT